MPFCPMIIHYWSLQRRKDITNTWLLSALTHRKFFVMIPDLIICIDKNAQARPRIVKYLECYNWDFSARVVHPLKLIHKLLLRWFYKSTLIRYTIWPVIVLFYVYRNRKKKFIAIGLETALPMAVLKVNFFSIMLIISI